MFGTGVSAYYLRHSNSKESPLQNLQRVGKFIFFSALLAPILNATFGISILLLQGKISSDLIIFFRGLRGGFLTLQQFCS